MEAEDVLADQVPRFGPEPLSQVLAWLRVGQSAQVVDQGIDPDVHHLLGIPGNRNTPGLARAAEAEVPQAPLDEAPRLVVAEARQHEIGPLNVEPQELVLERRQSEEPV